MNKKLARFLKGILFTLTAALILVFAIYSMAWFALTKRAEVIVATLWTDKDFTMTGQPPAFHGYPLPPETHFSGSMTHLSGLSIQIPDLYYFGYPAPHQIQFFEAKNGLSFTAPFLNTPLTLDYLAIQIRPPYRFPTTHRYDDVKAWQENNTPIVIPFLSLKAGTLSATGSGTVGLDAHLQITADMTARVMGMEDFLDTLATEHGEKTIAMARNFLTMLSKTDPTTGSRFFETTFKIQNRGIFLGPMRIAELPEMTWDGAPPPSTEPLLIRRQRP